MKREPFGTHLDPASTDESMRAWEPPLLPPDPPLEWSDDSRRRVDRALLALGRVDGVATALREADLVLPMTVRKEAALSSQLEGVECTLEDVLTFEAGVTPAAPLDIVREVSRYVDALQRGLEVLSGGSPPSFRLLRDLHGILIKDARRAPALPTGLPSLEEHLRRPANPIVRAALAHLHFEFLRPFADGNGRMGRLLVMLLLCEDEVLQRPMFCPSLYFRLNRDRYREELDAARAGGDYERWIDFFAEGVRYGAMAAVRTARRVMQTFHEDRALLRSIPRIAISLLLIQEALQVRPVATENTIREATGLTASTVHSMMGELQSRGIVNETSGRAKDKVYAYRRYLRAFAAEDKE